MRSGENLDPNRFDALYGREEGSGIVRKLLLAVRPFKGAAKKNYDKEFSSRSEKMKVPSRQILLEKVPDIYGKATLSGTWIPTHTYTNTSFSESNTE